MTTLRVKESFACDMKEGRFVFTVGELVDSKHPAVKGREALFDSVEKHMDNNEKRRSAVEQATAAPGEKRSVSTSKE